MDILSINTLIPLKTLEYWWYRHQPLSTVPLTVAAAMLTESTPEGRPHQQPLHYLACNKLSSDPCVKPCEDTHKDSGID